MGHPLVARPEGEYEEDPTPPCLIKICEICVILQFSCSVTTRKRNICSWVLRIQLLSSEVPAVGHLVISMLGDPSNTSDTLTPISFVWEIGYREVFVRVMALKDS